jgi:hypothetical protein
LRRPSHILLRRPSHILLRRPKHILLRRPRLMLLRRPRHILLRRPRHILLRRPRHILLRRPRHILLRRPKHISLRLIINIILTSNPEFVTILYVMLPSRLESLSTAVTVNTRLPIGVNCNYTIYSMILLMVFFTSITIAITWEMYQSM